MQKVTRLARAAGGVIISESRFSDSESIQNNQRRFKRQALVHCESYMAGHSSGLAHTFRDLTAFSYWLLHLFPFFLKLSHTSCPCHDKSIIKKKSFYFICFTSRMCSSLSLSLRYCIMFRFSSSPHFGLFPLLSEHAGPLRFSLRVQDCWGTKRGAFIRTRCSGVVLDCRES